MALRIQEVSKLAEELGKETPEVVQLLTSKGISTIGGYYDAALFDAVTKEPALTTKKRLEWGLSPRLGLGAVKAILDPMGVRVTVHDCRGSQWLMLRHGVKTVYVKWYYTNVPVTRKKWCNFEVRGFLRDDAPQNFLFTCFDGHFAWALSRATIRSAWTNMQQDKEVSLFSLVVGHEEHETGAVRIRLHTGTSKFQLQSPKQLGF